MSASPPPTESVTEFRNNNCDVLLKLRFCNTHAESVKCGYVKEYFSEGRLSIFFSGGMSLLQTNLFVCNHIFTSFIEQMLVWSDACNKTWTE